METATQPSRELKTGRSYNLGDQVVPNKLSWIIPWVILDNTPQHTVLVDTITAGWRGGEGGLVEIYDCSPGLTKPKWLGGSTLTRSSPYFEVARKHIRSVN